MYKKQSEKERVTSWMGRAAMKYQFPCAGHITVENYEGHPGYNFLDTFQSICWSPSMLTTEVIPSVLPKTRLWVSCCLSVLAYSCTVSGKPIDGDEEVFKSVRSGNQAVDPQREKEQTDLIKEAIYVLYGKRGIRFFPPRPGLELSNEEFVIPEFASGSKGD